MPAIARKDGTDTILTGHGCDVTTVTDKGSSDVLVNGIGACRLGDAIRIHTIPYGPYCVSHTAYIIGGSSTVFVNGIPVARLTDSADAGIIVTGSSDVFAG
jgi:uncharacterized Zn-binding protein involved in type VI secretion